MQSKKIPKWAGAGAAHINAMWKQKRKEFTYETFHENDGCAGSGTVVRTERRGSGNPEIRTASCK